MRKKIPTLLVLSFALVFSALCQTTAHAKKSKPPLPPGKTPPEKLKFPKKLPTPTQAPIKPK